MSRRASGCPLWITSFLCILPVFAGCSGTDADPTEQVESPPVAPSKAGPDAPRTVAQLRRELKANQNAEFRKVGGEIVEANLAGSGVRDIGPLKGLKLRGLSLQRLQVSDLRPLQGMPLTTLELMGVEATDLSPLTGLPLELLGLEETKVTDLSPLSGAPLKELYLNGVPIEDISALEGMPITKLNLVSTNVKDLTAIKGMPLNTLWLQDTSVEDLSPLEGSPIVSLDVAGATVSDLTPIGKMRSLERLNLVDSKVSDLSPLEGVRLGRLLFTPQNITDGIEVLREMSGLSVGFEKLNVQNTMPIAEFFAKYDAGEFRDESADANLESKDKTEATTDEEQAADSQDVES